MESPAPCSTLLNTSSNIYYNIQGLIHWGGALLVCIVVFIETGFFVGFFLPGDSLLVTAGIFPANGDLGLWSLLIPAIFCTIAGDQVGYWVGRGAGQAHYHRKDSFSSTASISSALTNSTALRRQDRDPRALRSYYSHFLPARGRCASR